MPAKLSHPNTKPTSGTIIPELQRSAAVLMNLNGPISCEYVNITDS